MASTISKVTQLDKEMRLKVKNLEQVKESLPEFLRERKKEMLAKKQLESKKEIEDRKEEIEQSINAAKKNADKRLSDSLKKIEKYYESHKDEWVEKIYDQIIKNYMGK